MMDGLYCSEILYRYYKLYRRNTPAETDKDFAGVLFVEIWRFTRLTKRVSHKQRNVLSRAFLNSSPCQAGAVLLSIPANEKRRFCGHNCLHKRLFSSAGFLPRCRGPPFLTFVHHKCSEMEEKSCTKDISEKKTPNVNRRKSSGLR